MSDASRALVSRLARRALSGARRRLRRAATPAVPAAPPAVHFRGLLEQPAAAEPGESILQLALRMDLDLDHFCGGRCSCGTCRVVIAAGGEHLSPPDGREQAVLGVALDRGDRLACQAIVRGPVAVHIPEFFGV